MRVRRFDEVATRRPPDALRAQLVTRAETVEITGFRYVDYRTGEMLDRRACRGGMRTPEIASRRAVQEGGAAHLAKRAIALASARDVDDALDAPFLQPGGRAAVWRDMEANIISAGSRPRLPILPADSCFSRMEILRA